MFGPLHNIKFETNKLIAYYSNIIILKYNFFYQFIKRLFYFKDLIIQFLNLKYSKNKLLTRLSDINNLCCYKN